MPSRFEFPACCGVPDFTAKIRDAGTSIIADVAMPITLSGVAALVTGGGQGIGRGIALELARAGCDVAVNYYEERDRTAQTVADIEALGRKACAVRADVRQAREVIEMVGEVVSRLGGLALLVNNAGVQTWGPFLETTEEDWDRVIDTNLKGVFLCTQAAARHMKDHAGGAIVNIGSGCNKVPFPELAAYTASKGGVEMLTKVSALELGRYGIRVNCVAPGAIEIERTRLESPDYGEKWGRVTPLGRVGTPADVAKAVVYLASENAAFITGQTLWVDGGLFTQGRWVYSETPGGRTAVTDRGGAE
jgi:NAD(P)-dependent dehydrogenase (short-subunit alcohol dehydrogenase family)